MGDDGGELDWLSSVMRGLDIHDKPTKVEYPEIDISYAFRPHNRRQPKLVRAIIEQQPLVKLSAKELDVETTHAKLSAHLQELDITYAFLAAAKPQKIPKISNEEIIKLARFKSIRACIHETWCNGNYLKNKDEQNTIHHNIEWTHEDSLAETRHLIATWNFVFKISS
jgi:hypothetical protein